MKKRLNSIVIFSVKVRNSFNTRVPLSSESARWYNQVEEYLCMFSLP